MYLDMLDVAWKACISKAIFFAIAGNQVVGIQTVTGTNSPVWNTVHVFIYTRQFGSSYQDFPVRGFLLTTNVCISTRQKKDPEVFFNLTRSLVICSSAFGATACITSTLYIIVIWGFDQMYEHNIYIITADITSSLSNYGGPTTALNIYNLTNCHLNGICFMVI